jgi:o-succinylbenzoate---CoA ligase
LIPTDWLRHRARSRPEVVAILDQDGRALSYSQLHARAEHAATALRESGAGSCLIEQAPGVDHAISLHAAMLAGVPFQSLRPALPGAERAAALAGLERPVQFDPGWLGEWPEGGQHRRANGQPDGRGTGGPAGPRLAAAGAGGWPPPAADDVLCRVLTSGTSGPRTPVELTYGNHFCSAAASAFNLGVSPSDRWLCCLPVDHVGGLSILIRSLIYGTTAIVHDGFDAERVATALGGEVDIVSLVPTQLQRLLELGAPLDRPRLILLGGAPVPAASLAEALERGANVVQTYGLTEACSQVCTLAAADASRMRGSAGRPLLGTEVAIAAGEIVVRGPTVAPGAAGPDGWLRTGDRGRIDAEGFLWVEGRADDVIVSGGENVAPEEVEAALRGHPSVIEAAVVGRPDPEWGSAVTAVVVAAPGTDPTEAELIDHCRGTLAAHKLPKAVEFAAALPRSASGKLLRRELR